MTPKLSIVVPVRNMNGKLKNLNSWIDEALAMDFEVILVEDTSNRIFTSELDEIVATRNHENLKKVSGDFGDPGSARNAGKLVSSGKWIAFWDADDRGIPKELFKILSNRDLESDLIVFSSETREWNTDSLISENHIDSHSGDILQLAKRPGVWRMVFRSNFIENTFFPPYKMAEDQVFLARVLHDEPDIKFIDEIVYSYFVKVPEQLTSSDKAIKDLGLAITDMNKLKGNAKTTLFIQELMIRQHISAIKYGMFTIKLKFTYKLLVHIFGRYSYTNLRLLIKVLTR